MSEEHTHSANSTSNTPNRYPSNPPSVISYDTLAHIRTMNLAEGLEEMANLQTDRQNHTAPASQSLTPSITSHSLDRDYFNVKKADPSPQNDSFSVPKSVSMPTGNWMNSPPSTPIARMDRHLRLRLMNQSDYSLSNNYGKESTNFGFFPNASPQSSASSENGQHFTGGHSSIHGSPLIPSSYPSFSNSSYGHMPPPLPSLSCSGRQILSSRPAFRSRKLNPNGKTSSSDEIVSTEGIINGKISQDSNQLLWTQTKEGKKVGRKAYFLFLGGISVGVLGAVALIVLGLFSSMNKNKYCLILEDNFDTPQLDTSVWKFERQTGGFGNNEFEWTTDSTNNTYIKDGMLHIVPTLTSDAFGDAAIENGYTLNLTTSAVCTSSDYLQCGVASNISTGTILPPIQSARLTTKGTKAIKFGRVEVRAKMPTGDWIWPAIWMMPKDSIYGDWPASGEIDIVESKGNKPKARADQLSNVVRSTLHWGPTTDQDAWWRTTGIAKAWRNFFNQEFYTFGLEWDETGIYTWQGSRVRKFMQVKFDQTFYQRGHFPSYSNNGTQITNPWAESKTPFSAPFDQEFYLIMNVAVGGTNGYFGDDEIGSNGAAKPWSNSGKHAARDFWLAKDKWLPTWPTNPTDRGMIVDYVKMYQKC